VDDGETASVPKPVPEVEAMQRRVLHYVFAVGLGVLIGWGLAVQRQASGADEDAPRAEPRRPADILGIAEEVTADRERAMAELVTLLTPDTSLRPSPEERARAAALLGDLHLTTPAIVEAAAADLYMAAPRSSGVTAYRQPPWETWPAFGVLAKVGLPAMPALVDEARTQEDKVKRQQCLLFLRFIVGEHARSWLQYALEREEDPAARARLEEALEYTFSGEGAYSRRVFFFQPQEGGCWYRDDLQ
jgi:hypothetical protein